MNSVVRRADRATYRGTLLPCSLLLLLICVGDPRKGGILGRFRVCWPHFGPCMGRWTAVGVEVERPQRSEDERPRNRRGSTANLAGGEAKTLRFKSSAASRDRKCAGDVVARAGAQPYLGPRTRSGDMMMD